MIEINNNLYILLLLVFYVMSIYRSAILISEDVGPLGIFENLRLLIDEMDYVPVSDEEETWSWYIINNLNTGINCVYCTGVWSAIILIIPFCLALFYPMWSLLLVILGGAGIQHYLTNK